MTEPLTPEPALVDPRLADAARPPLPLAGDCVAPRERVPPSPDPEDVRPPRRPSFLVVVLALVVAAMIGTPKAFSRTAPVVAGGVPAVGASLPGF